MRRLARFGWLAGFGACLAGCLDEGIGLSAGTEGASSSSSGTTEAPPTSTTVVTTTVGSSTTADDPTTEAGSTAATTGGTTAAPGVCGDGVVDAGEECDGAELDGHDCGAFGFDEGALGCAADCQSFDTQQCTFFTCGDGVIDPGEACDGADLAGESCGSLGFTGGELACAAGCGAFDTAACKTLATCGDGQLDEGELCDGDQLGGTDCTTFGFAGGALTCRPTCDGFDLTGCQ